MFDQKALEVLAGVLASSFARQRSKTAIVNASAKAIPGLPFFGGSIATSLVTGVLIMLCMRFKQGSSA